MTGKLTMLAGVVCMLTALPQAAGLDIRTFTSGTNLWIAGTDGLLTYSNESRTIKQAALNQFGEPDSIVDIVENDGMLWVSDRGGLYRIDMETQTRERIPFPGNATHHGKLAVDFDYVWVAHADSLWRYDKLGNEWFGFSLGGKPQADDMVLGLHSDGTTLWAARRGGMHVFSIPDEKWHFYPVKGSALNPDARYFIDNDAIIFVSEQTIDRYILNAQSWDRVDAGAPIVDIVRSSRETLILTEERVLLYTIENAIYRPLEIIGLQHASAFGRRDSLVYVVMPTRLVEFSIPAKSMNIYKNPPDLPDMQAVKILAISSDQVIIQFQDRIGIYFKSMGLWEMLPLSGLKKAARRVNWDDNGLVARYKKPFETRVTGYTGVDYLEVQTQWPLDTIRTLDSMLDTASGLWSPYYRTSTRPNYNPDSLLFKFRMTDPKASPPFNVYDRANLTFHTTLGQDRYCDVIFNNTQIDRVPRKEIYYRGNPADRLHSVRVGTTDFEAQQSPTLPATKIEGARVIVESKKKLETRDRKIIRSISGIGAKISTTRHEVLPFSPGLKYSIRKQRDEIIIPGSVQLTIDGELVDTVDFSFSYDEGIFNIRRKDLADQSSVIAIEYNVRTVPNGRLTGGWSDAEIIPEENYGAMGYTMLSVSPREWLSPRIGYTFIGDDTLNHILNVGVPVEVRKPGLLFKLEPDYSYNLGTNAGAGALGLQSRIGKNTSVLAKGLLAERGFSSTGPLSRGYGAISRELDFTVSHDIRKELPISYSQEHVRARDGRQDRYEFKAGAHFTNLPFADLTISRNTIDAVFADTITGADTLGLSPYDSIAIDTLDQVKDKIRLRIYETSSTFGEKVLRLKKLSYDFSATWFSPTLLELGADDPERVGSLYYGRMTMTPVQGITLTPIALYRSNPGASLSRVIKPTLIFQTIDVPPGFEIAGRFDWNLNTYGSLDSSNLDILRTIEATIKPGRWHRSLGWLSPLLGLEQNTSCAFATRDPRLAHVISGAHFQSSHTMTRILGVTLYPSDRILYKNENRWTRANDSLSFTTFNDFKAWIGKNNDQWQTMYLLTNRIDAASLTQSGFSSYERRWSDILNTTTGINFSHSRMAAPVSNQTPGVDSTGATSSFSLGPSAMVALAVGEFLFVRKFLNNHGIALDWHYRDQRWNPAPQLGYTMNINVIFKPNISLRFSSILGFKEQRFDNLRLTLRCMATF